MLKNNHMKRPYTTNVLHCWTGKSGNRDRPPQLNELKNCRSWWTKEFEIIKPQFLVLLGAKAIQSFGSAIEEDLTLLNLLENQGLNKSLGNIKFMLFGAPYPNSPYPNISKIYEQVFSTIKIHLSK